MICTICNFPTDSPTYNTRHCGCWKYCTHPICPECDRWRDFEDECDDGLTEQEAREC